VALVIAVTAKTTVMLILSFVATMVLLYSDILVSIP